MFAYELQRIHTEELLRRAARERLLQEARAARREARRAARDAGKGPVDSPRDRFAPAA
ncbi:hypothetical protein [Streptomyces liangshanensis]|uniref:hypothetical protein n=1 Tax=Streptomyces liangshanensis TaxID=2717324 RepID=UPI0036D76A06